MKLYSVFSNEFRAYGRVLKGYDWGDFFRVLRAETPLPETGFFYEASSPALENTPLFYALKARAFGGMPMQLGFCNGKNSRLNCLEYHKSSEICLMADDAVLLLGLLSEAEDLFYDADRVKAFFVPRECGVELFATTLHYAPCGAAPNAPYRVANALPAGTNGPLPRGLSGEGEDLLCRGQNKWLFAHAKSPEAENFFAGLRGENIDLSLAVLEKTWRD